MRDALPIHTLPPPLISIINMRFFTFCHYALHFSLLLIYASTRLFTFYLLSAGKILPFQRLWAHCFISLQRDSDFLFVSYIDGGRRSSSLLYYATALR